MKRIIVLGMSLLTLGAAPAMAADIPVKAVRPAAPIVTPAYNWNGFYIGIQGGFGWGRHNRALLPPAAPFTNDYNSRGWIAGGHAGYNWHFSQFLLGIEGDFMGANIRGDDAGVGGTVDQTTLRWVGTVRARAGVTFDQVLLYATGGWAVGNLRHTNFGPPLDEISTTRSGWTAGGGLEWGFLPNWSTRVEYRYYDFGKYSHAATPFLNPFEVRSRYHTIMGGISYRFGGPGPVVARY